MGGVSAKVKDLTVRNGRGFVTFVAPQKPRQMYRLVLDAGTWHPNVKVGRAISVEWPDENGAYHTVVGDVTYRRSNIIHVNGVLYE